MRMLYAVAAAAVTLMMSSAAFAAGPRAGSLGLNLMIGQDIPINGAMHGGVDNTYPDLAPLFPALAGQGGQVVINSRSFDDFYGASPLYRLAFSYARSDNIEFLLMLRHTEGESNLVQIGTVTTGGGSAPLFARFSDYRSSAAELGARVWLGESAQRLRAYAGARAGVARTDAIYNRLSAPGAASGETVVPFYDESTGFTGGIDFGVAYEVARLRRLNASVEIGAEVGVTYTSALEENDSVLDAVNAGGLNNDSGRVSAPVLVTLKMRWGGN